MPREIRLAIVGVGNCANALIQGLAYYDQVGGDIGLMHRVLGGYDVTDIKPVVAFDVNAQKVGRDLAEAIFAPPNNAYKLPNAGVKRTGVEVLMGPIEDGVPPHLAKYMEAADRTPVDVVQALKDAGAQVMLNMLPTGSAKATWLYGQAAVETYRAKRGRYRGHRKTAWCKVPVGAYRLASHLFPLPKPPAHRGGGTRQCGDGNRLLALVGRRRDDPG